MTGTFHGDRPIADEADDRFGLGIVADRLASALTHQSAKKGLVLGVEGAWGSGKSSLLALMIGRLRADHADAVEVVEFRPWLVGDRDQLLSTLFEDLTKAIAAIEHRAGDATRSTMLAAKDVAGTARRYARHLGSAGKLAGLAGLAVPGLGSRAPFWRSWPRPRRPRPTARHSPPRRTISPTRWRASNAASSSPSTTSTAWSRRRWPSSCASSVRSPTSPT